jgi:DNA-binding NtrC family response regulator
MYHYSTRSEAVKTIIKSLDLTRSLSIASIVIGEYGTGKRTLVRHLFPDLPVADGRDQDAVESLLHQTDSAIITAYDKLPNPDRIDLENKRIIAIADRTTPSPAFDETFAFIYTMPPLRERPEDIELYTQLFTREASETLMCSQEITLDTDRLDIRRNLLSLRASIYREIVVRTGDRASIEEGLYHYFRATLPHEADYRSLLTLFERPLIRAGLDHFGSQLKLAEALGINRNTLRKKIHEHF